MNEYPFLIQQAGYAIVIVLAVCVCLIALSTTALLLRGLWRSFK